MWRMLSYEINYHQNILLASFLLAVGFLCIPAFAGGWDDREKLGTTLMLVAYTAFFLQMFFWLRNPRERSDMRMAQVPIGSARAGLSRLLVMVVYWVGLIGAGVILHATSRETVFNWRVARGLISVGATMLSVNAFVLAMRDASMCFVMRARHRVSDEKLVRYLGTVAIFVMALSFSTLKIADSGPLLALKDYMVFVLFSPVGALGNVLMAVGLSAISVAVFSRRRDYTHCGCR